MIGNDIIKQIVLKFKAEGTPEIQKQIQAMTKAGGFTNAREVDKTLQNMNKVQQTFAKSGMQMSNEFSKVKKIFEEINQKHLEQSKNKIERITRLMRDQAKDLQRMQETGASQAQMQSRMAMMAQTENLFRRVAGGMPEVAAKAAPTPMNVLRAFGAGAAGGGGIGGGFRGVSTGVAGGLPVGLGVGALGLLGMFGTAQSMYGQYSGQYYNNQSEARAMYASFLKQRRMDVYQGNLSEAAFAVEGGYSKAKDSTDKRIRAEDERRSGMLKWGGAALGAGLIGAGALLSTTGIGAVGGVPMMIAGAAMAGGGAAVGSSLMYRYGGGREVTRQQMLTQELARKREETITPELMAEFRSRQRGRLQFMSQFGMSGADLYRFRGAGYSNLFDENEMMQAAAGMRQFGAGNAANMAVASAYMARGQGSSMAVTTRQMSAMAMNAIGGEKRAAENLREVFSTGVAGGIKDSGLLDNFKDLVGTIMASSGYRTDAAKMADTIAKSLTTGDAREMAAVPGGLQGVSALMGGAGGTTLDQQLTFNSALKTLSAKGVTGPAAISMAGRMQAMSFAEAMAGGSESFRSATGLNQEDIRSFALENIKSRANRYAEGRATLGKALQGGASQKQMDQAIQYMVDMGVVQTEDQARVALTGMRTQLGVTTPGTVAGTVAGKTQAQVMQEGVAEEIAKYGVTTTTPEGKAERKRFEGMEALDKDVQDKISANIDRIITTYNDAMVKQLDKTGTNLLDEATDNIVDSANRLADALDKAAARIGGTSAHRNMTPSNGN